ncbi:glycogen synthase [Listeria weihenstephanensis FSL R9-0317]|uniref:Glycogen synthase n=1 Tax=Listeria weihenstephanensis TaxID=1006155 RepID=A0A1S7FT64_9LIST|nr:glycogen synthase GlgA [Listeria weihenstephanensis]AQY50648.1 glycogen synthase [Listeria weihenstephanensis]EUJ35604.1 glycogen synthase [Listeria weihenstephanensis FSL R9-0317]MBC1499601.1 glycogen synthase GlgA [Listeria weihenstephanensis]
MKVLFAAAEVFPFVKVGGLADVAYALPKELVKQGVDIRVVLPFHTKIAEEYKSKMVDVTQFTVDVGWRKQFCGVKMLEQDGVTFYFIDNMYYFDRPNVYGDYDDAERYAFFSMAVCEMMEKIDFIPDWLHVNDWHTGIVPLLLQDKYHWIESYRGIRTVLTIHNLQFQGIYSPRVLEELLGIGMQTWHEDGIKYYENVNFMKGAIQFADRITTVSPSYAKEIQTAQYGENLDGLLRANAWKLVGILNGIDQELNDPETDPLIPTHFSKDDLAGKAANKAAMQKRLGLPVRADVPLIIMVSRLTHQKGCQLLEESLDQLLQKDIQIAILGNGESQFEDSFRFFEHVYPEKMSANIAFDIGFAQQLYAAGDMLLMPSWFEPCGISQLIAMRYGTLPIVHETGGLKDTVTPYNQYTQEGTGFSFDHYNATVFRDILEMAIAVFSEQPVVWQGLVEQAMEKDFSWKVSAEKYKGIYEEY